MAKSTIKIKFQYITNKREENREERREEKEERREERGEERGGKRSSKPLEIYIFSSSLLSPFKIPSFPLEIASGTLLSDLGKKKMKYHPYIPEIAL